MKKKLCALIALLGFCVIPATASDNPAPSNSAPPNEAIATAFTPAANATISDNSTTWAASPDIGINVNAQTQAANWTIESNTTDPAANATISENTADYTNTWANENNPPGITANLQIAVIASPKEAAVSAAKPSP